MAMRWVMADAPKKRNAPSLRRSGLHCKAIRPKPFIFAGNISAGGSHARNPAILSYWKKYPLGYAIGFAIGSRNQWHGGGEAPPMTAEKAKPDDETKGLRRKAFNSETAPIRAAAQELRNP